MAIGTRSSGRGTAPFARSVAGGWRGKGRRAAALSGCLLLLVLVAALVAASSFAGTSANSLDKVDPAVVKAVDGGGETTFWAVLHQQADLSAAPGMNRSARGKFVYERLNSVANESQAGLRSLLEQQSASFKPFWVVNAIRIRGDATLVQTVAARPEVAEILATSKYEIPKPVPATGRAAVDAVEWDIDRIRADEVWSTFGDRGEGIVVANIDTGVQFNHPALVAQYRGNTGRRHVRPQLQLVRPLERVRQPVARPVRQQRPRHAHDGHDGRRRRRSGREPDRRRPHARAGSRPRAARRTTCSRRGAARLGAVDARADRPQRARIRAPTCGRTSSTTRGAAAAATRSTRRPSRPGSPPASSPRSRTATPARAAARRARPATTRRATAPARSTSTTSSPASRAAAPRPSAARSSRTSPLPASTCAAACRANAYASSTARRWPSPHVAGTVALMWSAAPALDRRHRRDEGAARQHRRSTPRISPAAAPPPTTTSGARAGSTPSPRSTSRRAVPTGTLTGTVTEPATAPRSPGPRSTPSVPSTGRRRPTANGQYSLRLPVGTYDVTASAFGCVSRDRDRRGHQRGRDHRRRTSRSRAAPSHQVSGHVRDTDGHAGSRTRR